MAVKKQLPYGLWPSRITPRNTAGLLDLSETAWNGKGDLLWREREARAASLQMLSAGQGEIACLSGEYAVGGGLLYGGGSYGADQKSAVFVDRISQQLIRYSFLDGGLSQLTADLVLCGSPVLSPDGQSALFVHSDGEKEAIYLIDLARAGIPAPVISGADFFNYPRWHPGGRLVAWMSWNHPCMPWDSSSLWLGSLEHTPEGKPQLASETLIAGGEGISVLQPEFSPDGKSLAFLSDQSGWWQIHLYDLERGESRQLTTVPAEHALPPWLQNQTAYGFSPDSQKLYLLRNQDGFRSLRVIDLKEGEESRIALDQPYTWLDWFSISPREEKIALIASASDQPPRLITVDPTGRTTILRSSAREDLPKRLFSIPKPIAWINEGDKAVKGLFYPPHNPGYQAAGPPPLLVIIHSGPTRQKVAEFSPRTQFFTSRGFAVLEVNYRGSSGYGRAYRQSLQGAWGAADVEDCLSGALYVTQQGWADWERMALLGSSSGGLTVYQILVRHPGIFQAAIVLYGIVNQLDLLKDPLKFERYYSQWLIGPYPEQEALYRERSPIFNVGRIRDPIAIFQGGKDPIVPREQADQIVQALEENRVPHLYRLYPGEGHGFKAAEAIEDFYQQSLQFLTLQAGITPGG